MSESSSNTVFVTGATGLVGSHMVVKLVQEGKSVRALKRADSDLSEIQRLFDHYSISSSWNKVSWVDGDITDITSLLDGMKGVDTVYHVAALVSFDPRDRMKLYNINIEGTANVVNACLELGVKKLGYVSSTAAVGKSPDNSIVKESNDWEEELVTSNYAISKHYAENEVWRGVAEGLDAVVVNPCVVIGPGDWNRSSGTLFRTVYEGLKYYTSGANAFVDVRDIADALFSLVESDVNEERFLIIGENMAYQSLFTKIANAFNVNPPSVLVKGFWINIAWRLEKVRSFFTGRPPVVTKESAKSAISTVEFDGNKITYFVDFSYRTVDEAIANSVKYYQNSTATPS